MTKNNKAPPNLNNLGLAIRLFQLIQALKTLASKVRVAYLVSLAGLALKYFKRAHLFFKGYFLFELKNFIFEIFELVFILLSGHIKHHIANAIVNIILNHMTTHFQFNLFHNLDSSTIFLCCVIFLLVYVLGKLFNK